MTGPDSPLLFSELEELHAKTSQDILEKHGMAGIAPQSLPAHVEDEINKTLNHCCDEALDKIHVAFMKAARTLGIDCPDIPSQVTDKIHKLTHTYLFRILEHDDAISALQVPDDG